MKKYLLLFLSFLGIGSQWAPPIEAHWGFHELQELKRYLPTEGIGDPNSGGQMLGKVSPSAPTRLEAIGILMLGLLIGGAIALWLQEKKSQAHREAKPQIKSPYS